MIKTVSKVEIERAYPSIIKAIYEKLTTNIILNGQKLKSVFLSLRLGTIPGCLLSPLLFNMVLEALATTFRKEEEIKGIPIGKEEVKLSLFTDDKIVYLENPVGSTKKLLNLINEFSKMVGYKVNIQKSMTLLFTNNVLSERETKEKIPFTIATKNKVPRDKFNQVKDLYWKTIGH